MIGRHAINSRANNVIETYHFYTIPRLWLRVVLRTTMITADKDTPGFRGFWSTERYALGYPDDSVFIYTILHSKRTQLTNCTALLEVARGNALLSAASTPPE